MKLGFIITMYDELNEVLKNVEIIKKDDCKIIVIQSDPKNQNIFDATKSDHYELLPDLAGSKDSYMEGRVKFDREGKGTPIFARALSRNFSHGFTAAKNFDVDWWVAIVGDMSISNLDGIKKIIRKLERTNKAVGFTRGVGIASIFPDHPEYSRMQWLDTTDFMPQFFIVRADLVRRGLFNQISITNPYMTEQCLGDEILRFCIENNMRFWDICHSVRDYSYPRGIEGVHYNPDKVSKLPRYTERVVFALRRLYLRITGRPYPI